MRATITLTNDTQHTFKGRHLDILVEQGMLSIISYHPRTVLYSAQQINVYEVLLTGDPKGPKETKKPTLDQKLEEFYRNKVETQFDNYRQQLANLNDNMLALAERAKTISSGGTSLQLDITASTAEAFVAEIATLLDDEDSHLLSTLVEKIGDRLTDRFASTIDSQGMSISSIATTLSTLQVAVHALQALQPPTISIAPPQPFPLAVPPSAAPAPMPTPVAIDQAYVEEAKPADAAEGRPLNKDSRAVLEHEKVNGFCRECDKMTRHSVACATLLARRNETPVEVQEASCAADAQPAE